MTRSSLWLLSLAVLACGAVAQADEKIDPARLDQARKLVKLVTPKSIHDESIKQMTENMLPAFRAQGMELPPDAEKRFMAAVADVVPYDEVVEFSARMYAKRFTLEELKELEAFYRTPLGRKLARELPSVSGEIGKHMGELIPKRLPQALRKHGLIE